MIADRNLVIRNRAVPRYAIMMAGGAMVEVNRHEVFPESSTEALAQLAGDIGEHLDAATRDTDVLGPLFLAALRRLGHRSALDPAGRDRETWDSLVFALDVGSAIFTAADVAPGTELVCRLGDEVRVLSGTGPVHHATAENWLTTMWLAILARDATLLERHTAVPIETLRGSGVPEPDYLFSMVRMLQLFFRRETGADMALNSAAGHGDPAGFDDRSEREAAAWIRYPEQRLFHYFLVEYTDEQFNDALVEALRYHQTYWTGDGDRAGSPFGFVALGPLALTAVAHDAGTAITVRSDYLPVALYDGSAFAEHR